MAVVSADFQLQRSAMSLKADEVEDTIGEGVDSNKRSERKRQREKQRRSDLSNAFDELAAFIVQVEPEPGEEHMDFKKKRKKSEGEDSSGITRLDLISRALKMMERLHRENEERKRIIKDIQGRGGGNDNMLVVVPTLAPLPDDTYPVARASYPSNYQNNAPPNYYPPSHPHPSQHNTAPQEYSMPGQPPRGGGGVHPAYNPNPWARYGGNQAHGSPTAAFAAANQGQLHHPSGHYDRPQGPM